MAAHQASPSLGFSRQEHWSELPFPSPMHESEKWKWSPFSRIQLFVTPWNTAHQAPPSMVSSRQEHWSGLPLPSLGRKTKGLQTEKIGCKCQTCFYLSLKQQEETNYKCQIFFFFPSLYKIKRRFLLKFCVAVMTPGSTWTQLFSNLVLTKAFFLWKCFS